MKSNITKEYNIERLKIVVYICLIVSFFFLLALLNKVTDPYRKYEGYWEYKIMNDSEGEKIKYHVMEISKQGKSYLLNLNVLTTQDATLLSKGNKQLFFGGICGIPIGFGANTDILLFNRDTYSRIDAKQLRRIQSNGGKRTGEHDKR